MTQPGSTYLSAAFFDATLEGAVRVLAADADNRLSTEADGQETFLGGGIYYGDDGSEAEVGVVIVRIPESSSATASEGELRGLLERHQGDLNVDVTKLRELQRR